MLRRELADNGKNRGAHIGSLERVCTGVRKVILFPSHGHCITIQTTSLLSGQSNCCHNSHEKNA
jgi:hypothetical protein